MKNSKLSLLLASASTAALIGGQAAITPAQAQVSIVSMAAVVSGQVRIENADRSLPGATVRLEGLNFTTTTDSEGRFVLTTSRREPTRLT